jgi:hypothetical protein
VNPAVDALRRLIESEVEQPVPPKIAALSSRIREGRHGVLAVLFYGAGLWKSPESDTLFDFYVLVESYQAFDPRRLYALFGWLLPPNVYYLEHGGLRCKYALIRFDQFEASAAGGGLNSQIWARFSQPCRLVYARDRDLKRAVTAALGDAVVTFHDHSLPLLGPTEVPRPETIWTRGLEQTYGNEWRSERGERAHTIYQASREALNARSELVLPFCSPAPRPATIGLRRILAKSVYFLQLMKAVFTFEGGVDYALWKIERQSGVRLHASEFQRRHPLISAWPLVWKAWRLGILR